MEEYNNFRWINGNLLMKSLFQTKTDFFGRFFYEIDHCASLEGVTKDSGRWSLPISYSEVLCVKRPTPDSEMWIVFGAAKFCIRLIFGLNPSIKFWKDNVKEFDQLFSNLATRIVLVGPPGSKRKEIALGLTAHFSEEGKDFQCISVGDLITRQITQKN